MLSVEQLRAREWVDTINSKWPFKIVYRCLCLLSFCLYQQNDLNLPLDDPNRFQFPVVVEAFCCFSSFHSKGLILPGAKIRHFSVLVGKIVDCMTHLPLLNPVESEEVDGSRVTLATLKLIPVFILFYTKLV